MNEIFLQVVVEGRVDHDGLLVELLDEFLDLLRYRIFLSEFLLVYFKPVKKVYENEVEKVGRLFL